MNFKSWTQLTRKTIYSSPHLRVYLDKVRLPDQTVLDDYSVVELNDVCMCVITDTNGDVILLREYRYAVDKVMWNLPAGTFRRGTEDPKAAALRELEEETGYVVDSITHIGTTHEFPTKATHTIHIFRATGARPSGKPRLERTEQLEVHVTPVAEVKKMVLEGQFETNSAFVALVLGLATEFGWK